MTVKVNITKELLEESAECMFPRSKNCAISVAFQQALPNRDIETGCIYLNIGLKSCELSGEAQEFIKEFDKFNPDERRNMEPQSFNIEIPETMITEESVINSKYLELV